MDQHLQQPLPPQLKRYLKKLLLFGGIFWVLAYVLMIHRGFVDHTNAMPGLALFCNFSWEIVFSFLYIPPLLIQRRSNLIWCILDSILLIQFLIYGHTYFLAHFPVIIFYLASVVLLVVCLFYIVMISRACDDTAIGRYTAFGGNMLMSALFIYMLQDKGIIGQSLYIALFKMCGTAIFSYAFVKGLPKDRLTHLMAVNSIALDIIYVLMLYLALEAANLNPLLIY